MGKEAIGLLGYLTLEIQPSILVVQSAKTGETGLEVTGLDRHRAESGSWAGIETEPHVIFEVQR